MCCGATESGLRFGNCRLPTKCDKVLDDTPWFGETSREFNLHQLRVWLPKFLRLARKRGWDLLKRAT